MKYILAVFLIIGVASSFPVGESDHSSSSSESVANPNSLGAKSQESDEVHKHDHDEESHKDVSHEHHKHVQQDSSETSEESSESIEKSEQSPKIAEESKSGEEKLLEIPKLSEEELQKPKVSLDEPEKPKEDKVDEPEAPALKSLIDEKIDILEVANKPAAIAAESAVLEEHNEKGSVGILEKKISEEPLAVPESIPEGKEIQDNPIEIKDVIPEEEIKQELLKNADNSEVKIDSKPEGKSELPETPMEIENEKPKVDAPALKSEVKEEIEKHIHEEAIPEKAESVKILELKEPEPSSEKQENINPSS